MKTVILLSVALFASGTLGFVIKVPDVLAPTKIRSGGWTHLQKVILQLFDNICEDSTDPIIVKNAEEFTLDSSSGVYSKPEVIDNLRNLKTGKGLLPKGEIFTEYDKDHINELRVIYDVFYHAKDFSTFLKAAAWARQNVNCGLFFDAVYLSVLSRRDTEVLSIPAPYEILPNYFISRDIIIKASTILSGEQIIPSETVHVVGNSYVLDANYTADIYDNYESKLAYFHEDVGLNSYYFLQKIKKAPWFNLSPDMNDRYGEYLYHMMRQLAIRYDLERYSNGLPEVDGIDWTSFSAAPYDPMLVYSNGNEFGQRKTFVDTFDATSLDVLQGIENNIATVVDHLISSGYNKTQILNHIMEILVTGDKSYETVARTLVGKDSSLDSSLPSVMDHYITSLRDPVFWKINKQIVNIVDRALTNLPTYTRSELYFPGIEVQNVEVKKMSTFFETFEIDVTDALKTANIDTTFQVKIEQPRLNHKPFTMKLYISSLVTNKGLVKIYLGPKVAPGQFVSKRNQFMLLDSFEANFKIGTNVISRSSEEMKDIAEDLPSFRALRKKVEDAEFGIGTMSFLSEESKTGFPSRFILPKGSPEGVPLQIFVFVAPFVKFSSGSTYQLPSLEFNSALLSPGFPLDSNIDDTLLFSLPNAMLSDVVITHKDGKKSSSDGSFGGDKWQGGSGSGGRPDFTKKDFDYTSRKEQYGKKSDYGPTRSDYKKTVEDKTENQNTDDVISNTESFTTGKIELNKDTDQYIHIDLLPEVLDVDKVIPIWQEGSERRRRSGSTGRPDFTKKNFDYKSRKEQYAKKTDYGPKRGDYKKTIEDKKENKKTDDVNLNTEDFTTGIMELNKERYQSDVLPGVQDVDEVVPKWQRDSESRSGSGGRPDFAKKKFDYKSRKAQYEKKTDYGPKRGDYKKTVEDKTEYKKTDDVNLNTEDFTTGKMELIKEIYQSDVLSGVQDVDEVIPKWQGGSERRSGSGGRPDFAKKKFDYKSRKAQYEKKTDYGPKRGDYKKTVEDKTENKKTDDVNLNTEDFTTGKMELNKDRYGRYVYVLPRVQDFDEVMPTAERLYFDVPRFNRTPSVYDYLFNRNNDIDYTEFKVYE